MSRWLSVILLEYNNRDAFLDRDAGLFAEGLRQNGVSATFVAIGDASAQKEPGVLLATLDEMERTEWWAGQGIEGALVYSWAQPQFTKVVTAARASGIKLVLILDTDGYVAPQVSWRLYFRNEYYRNKERGRFFPLIGTTAKTLFNALPARHRPILDHLECADLLAVPSAMAVKRYARYLEWLGRPDLARRVAPVPYPVSGQMVYDASIPKEPIIVAVGGWHRLQKNAPLLVTALGDALAASPLWKAEIIGTGEDRLLKLVSGLPKQARGRIKICGPVPNDQLPRILRRCRISLCTSYHESFHLATAEALCCGCSFVGDGRISSMASFASMEGSGTISPDLSKDNLVKALRREMELWDGGQRDPVKIGRTWTGLVHPKQAAAAILRHLGK
jgi:hypothetical protein